MPRKKAPRTKRYNGKIYRFDSQWDRKSDAVERAKYLRNPRTFARVHHNTKLKKWIVYERYEYRAVKGRY